MLVYNHNHGDGDGSGVIVLVAILQNDLSVMVVVSIYGCDADDTLKCHLG